MWQAELYCSRPLLKRSAIWLTKHIASIIIIIYTWDIEKQNTRLTFKNKVPMPKEEMFCCKKFSGIRRQTPINLTKCRRRGYFRHVFHNMCAVSDEKRFQSKVIDISVLKST